jgi:hypothetical protein
MTDRLKEIDPEGVAAAEQFVTEARLAEMQYTVALGNLLRNGDGRLFVSKLLDRLYYFSYVFEGSSQVYRKAALQDVAKQLVQEMFHSDPKETAALLEAGFKLNREDTK